jgi:hypothetical protein
LVFEKREGTSAVSRTTDRMRGDRQPLSLSCNESTLLFVSAHLKSGVECNGSHQESVSSSSYCRREKYEVNGYRESLRSDVPNMNHKLNSRNFIIKTTPHLESRFSIPHFLKERITYTKRAPQRASRAGLSRINTTKTLYDSTCVLVIGEMLCGHVTHEKEVYHSSFIRCT